MFWIHSFNIFHNCGVKQIATLWNELWYFSFHLPVLYINAETSITESSIKNIATNFQVHLAPNPPPPMAPPPNGPPNPSGFWVRQTCCWVRLLLYALDEFGLDRLFVPEVPCWIKPLLIDMLPPFPVPVPFPSLVDRVLFVTKLGSVDLKPRETKIYYSASH